MTDTIQPIINAARMGDVDALQTLITADTNLNATDEKGYTP
ncbi:hypothetical protein [Mucilaginibacter antarcticus]